MVIFGSVLAKNKREVGRMNAMMDLKSDYQRNAKQDRTNVKLLQGFWVYVLPQVTWIDKIPFTKSKPMLWLCGNVVNHLLLLESLERGK